MGVMRKLAQAMKWLPGNLITGIVSLGAEGWTVTWISDGAEPGPVHAPTLIDAADQAAAAVAALHASHPPVPGAELQLAIYPWDYRRGGPIFDIDAGSGGFTAHDIQAVCSTVVHGQTLEDLVSAVERAADPSAGGSMFRWIRQVAGLPTYQPQIDDS
jgi:hypothetical protein